jgi:hypothetical protein
MWTGHSEVFDQEDKLRPWLEIETFSLLLKLHVLNTQAKQNPELMKKISANHLCTCDTFVGWYVDHVVLLSAGGIAL